MKKTSKLLVISIMTALLAVQCTNRLATPSNPAQASRQCLSGPAKASDRFGLVHGYITYSDGSEIWAVDPNHTSTRISLGLSNGSSPIAWSHDGNRLLLRTAGTNNFNGDLCVVNADGSQTRLTSDGLSSEGSFSSTGTKVVFVRQDDGLYVVGTTGGTPRRIAKSYGAWWLESPAWSPDGSRVAYMVYLEGGPEGLTYQIWTVKPDGTDLRPLVDLGYCERGGCSAGLAWSPDGSMLAFHSARGNPHPATAIYTVRADGSGLRRLNESGTWPSWSPDGSRIIFNRGPDLFTMAADGSEVTLMENLVIAPNRGCAWNPVVTT